LITLFGQSRLKRVIFLNRVLTLKEGCAILIAEKKVETPVSHQSELVNISFSLKYFYLAGKVGLSLGIVYLWLITEFNGWFLPLVFLFILVVFLYYPGGA
jgi:hypothetical protein